VQSLLQIKGLIDDPADVIQDGKRGGVAALIFGRYGHKLLMKMGRLPRPSLRWRTSRRGRKGLLEAAPESRHRHGDAVDGAILPDNVGRIDKDNFRVGELLPVNGSDRSTCRIFSDLNELAFI
jgi:hypothetical protein